MHMHRMMSHFILLNCLVIMIELLGTKNSRITSYGVVHIAIELGCTGNTENLLDICKMKHCKKNGMQFGACGKPQGRL